MTNLIHTETVDDLGLIYLKDEGVAGIHIKGLAKLLGCNPGTIYGAMNAGVRRSDFIEVDMPTAGGIQGVRFIARADGLPPPSSNSTTNPPTHQHIHL